VCPLPPSSTWDVRELVYTYDMGDDWRHIIAETVGRGEPDVKYPALSPTSGAARPTASAAYPRHKMFLDAMAAPPTRTTTLLRRVGRSYNSDDMDEHFTKRASPPYHPPPYGQAAYQKSRPK
jgi:hypothetical protein